MTLPDERYRAVLAAEEFLYELLDPKKTKVPKRIREQARSILRHYPSDWHMVAVCDVMPEYFRTELDPLTKMVMNYENQVDKNSS